MQRLRDLQEASTGDADDIIAKNYRIPVADR